MRTFKVHGFFHTSIIQGKNFKEAISANDINEEGIVSYEEINPPLTVRAGWAITHPWQYMQKLNRRRKLRSIMNKFFREPAVIAFHEAMKDLSK